MTIYDPACGTGGFLLAAYDYISHNYSFSRLKRFDFILIIYLLDKITKIVCKIYLNRD